MRKPSISNIITSHFIIILMACGTTKDSDQADTDQSTSPLNAPVEMYAPFKLTTDTALLSQSEKDMIPHLIKAAQIIDELFWVQAYGEKEPFLKEISNDRERRFAEFNYGPWDRLNGNKAFMEGYEQKPLGANMYPSDVTKAEIVASDIDSLGQYSMVRRQKNGELHTIPYHVFFKKRLERAANYLREAAEICETPSLKKYLSLRAEALITDDFTESDIAWLQMKDNGLDIIIGPIENYEDGLYNARTSYGAYVLVKDKAWSKKLERYIAFLPELQKSLPVDPKYKAESPGTSSQLNAYDVIYYAGDCNSGSKTIAVNLPNDETLQTSYGTRRSQLKNAMKAKFDNIMLPISDVLIDSSQRQHVTFNAFFENTMFHEVAHGLGIKNTLEGPTVRHALQEHFSPLEEGKADILGLYMVTYLRKKGVLTEGELMNNYVTFMAGIFRSVRFGAASAHGQANMVRFNFFNEHGAFIRDESTGTYSVDADKMRLAMNDLSALIIRLQGNGDKEGVVTLMKENGMVKQTLQEDLDRLTEAGIPVDIYFEQGLSALGMDNNVH
jgi:Peptidase family M49